MPHSYGQRRKTRNLFSKGFRRHGTIAISRYLTTFHRGDYVDIKADPTQTMGMPYKSYHGKTGRVFNVGVRAIGVTVNRVVRSRIVRKRINVRVEHLQISRCREAFIERVHHNEQEKKAHPGQQLDFKRKPLPPREAHLVDVNKTKVTDQHPLEYVFIS